MSAGREELVAALEQLADEARSGRTETWENDTLPAFLEAPAAWLKVFGQAYANTGRPIPTDPWEVLAAAVRAATIYE
jgi:hypothetical protein